MNTSGAEATIINSVAGLIEKALRTYDSDPEPLFTAAGIDRNVSMSMRPLARLEYEALSSANLVL